MPKQKPSKKDTRFDPIGKKERLRLPSNNPDNTFTEFQHLQDPQSKNLLDLPQDILTNILAFLPLGARPSINMTNSAFKNAMNAASGAAMNKLTNEERKDLHSALYNSIDEDNPASVKNILSINKGRDRLDLNEKLGTFSTPLVEAAAKGNLEIIKALVENGADPNQVDEYDWTPIYAAASKGHLDVVRYFVEDVGQDAGKAKNVSVTPIYIAASQGNVDVVRYLVEDAKQDAGEAADDDGSTPIYAAAVRGNLDVVRYLVEDAKQDAGKADINGATPINVAAYNGYLDVVRYLVEDAKVDAGKADINGTTPIHAAAYHGHLDVVRYLVEEAKVDFNKATNDGWTPLRIATLKEHAAVADYLRSIGAQE